MVIAKRLVCCGDDVNEVVEEAMKRSKRKIGDLACLLVICVVLPYTFGAIILAICGQNLLPGYLTPVTVIKNLIISGLSTL
jgi:hypothetical protein